MIQWQKSKDLIIILILWHEQVIFLKETKNRRNVVTVPG